MSKGPLPAPLRPSPVCLKRPTAGPYFLDEIADTTPTFQAKLLRVLQEGEIKRVGGTQPIKIDVRVISATNKDLTDLVKAKTFRPGPLLSLGGIADPPASPT